MALALAALGSNLGDRAATLKAAVEHLRQHPQIKLLAVSRWHETLPAGGPTGQSPFLNGAVLLETWLTPQELLQVFQEIEQAAERRREIHWGPRTLDVDLLLYDQLVLDTPELTLPHPRMMFRRFVMEPAAEIAPQLVHPLLGWRLDELRDHLARARNYIALFAPPGVSTRELAEQLHAAVASKLIADAVDSRLSARSEKALASCFATLERQARLLDQKHWGEFGLGPDELLISDFWLGGATIDAAACFESRVAADVYEAWERTFRETISPKLVVWLSEGTSTPTEISHWLSPSRDATSGNRPCEIPLNREQLQQWEASALGLFAGGFGGPWLKVNLADPAAALIEITAAALAMR